VTAVEFHDLLAQAGSIAAERGWTAVTDFISSLSATDEILLFEAEDVDAGSLADWIAGEAGSPVTIAGLEGLAGDFAAGLYTDRVVVAFRCGKFLTLSQIEAAQQLMQRPPGSYAIIFTDADVVQDENDLNILERGIWQTLVGNPDIRWAGQDLAEYWCLLWGEPRPGGFMADRLERDKRMLREWLLPPDGARAGLAALRAGHAVDLAERAAALTGPALTGPAATPRAESAGLRGAQKSLEELRRQLLKQLDADASYLDSEIEASLDEVRRQTRAAIARRVRQHGDASWTDQELGREIEGVVRLALDTWHEEIAATARERGRATQEAARKLLGGVDWELIDSVRDDGDGDGDGGYPDLILTHIGILSQAVPAIGERPAAASLSSLPKPDARTTVVRVTASGAALAAVAAIIAWPAVVPVLAAGAAGAVGGSLLDRRLDTRSNHQAAEALAADAVNQAVNVMLDAAREQVRSGARSGRQALTADFRNLDDALHAAALRQAGRWAAARLSPGAAGPTAAAGSDQARVAELRRRYEAVLEQQRA
jgi:hypothetical protein